MTVTPDQMDEFQELQHAAAPNVAPAAPNSDAASAMVAPAPGILLPNQNPVGQVAQNPALSAQGPSSPTNASPAPGSFGAKFGAAAAQLVKAGSDPMSA